MDTHVGRRRRSLWKIPAFVTALILLIPLLGNHFVDGWNWPPGAFFRFGTILFGLGVAYQLATRTVDAIAYRAAVGVALAGAFLLAWVNFVQFVDGNPAAATYFGVPVLGAIGTAMARLQPAGMARALFVTALAQALALATALIIWNPQATAWTPAVARGFGLNAFFAILFLGSALLFRKIARRETAPEH
jgi:hypothetical protein